MIGEADMKKETKTKDELHTEVINAAIELFEGDKERAELWLSASQISNSPSIYLK